MWPAISALVYELMESRSRGADLRAVPSAFDVTFSVVWVRGDLVIIMAFRRDFAENFFEPKLKNPDRITSTDLPKVNFCSRGLALFSAPTFCACPLQGPMRERTGKSIRNVCVEPDADIMCRMQAGDHARKFYWLFHPGWSYFSSPTCLVHGKGGSEEVRRIRAAMTRGRFLPNASR
tara:strand:+ start:298 stop:828 length:531 start_codon:yes stop_codon:yes gene_type:complete